MASTFDVLAEPTRRRLVYRVRPEPLAEIDAWLAPYRHLWAKRLDALEQHLDALEQHLDATEER